MFLYGFTLVFCSFHLIRIMPINKVPKFVEHRVAERRRLAKSGGQNRDIQKQRKYSAFDAARKKYQDSQKIREEKEKQKAERDALHAEKKKERKNIGRLINKRNERGQPNMTAQLEVLMKKFHKA